VRYLDAGSASGRVLILLHAFPLSADQWLPQMLRVPLGWRYVAPDLRGFRGRVPAFEDQTLDGISIDTYAADTFELMTHLAIPAAGVVGLSMGGYVALAMTRQAPARVWGLVLANTRASADSADGRAARDAMVALVRSNGMAAVADQMLPKLLGATTRREQPDLEDALRGLIECNSADGVAAALGAMRDRTDSTASLASIACPVTVIGGGEDAVVPREETEAMHAAIPGARLVVLPRAGHLSNLEDAAGFRRALESAG
jgi:pimeloyl-ACP methyl ester carboxylesterase